MNNLLIALEPCSAGCNCGRKWRGHPSAGNMRYCITSFGDLSSPSAAKPNDQPIAVGNFIILFTPEQKTINSPNTTPQWPLHRRSRPSKGYQYWMYKMASSWAKCCRDAKWCRHSRSAEDRDAYIQTEYARVTRPFRRPSRTIQCYGHLQVYFEQFFQEGHYVTHALERIAMSLDTTSTPSEYSTKKRFTSYNMRLRSLAATCYRRRATQVGVSEHDRRVSSRNNGAT